MRYQDRFTQRAQSALTKAQEAAQEMGHSYVGTEHILLGIALVSILGASLWNVVLALSIVYTPRVARVVRASTLVIRAENFPMLRAMLPQAGPLAGIEAGAPVAFGFAAGAWWGAPSPYGLLGAPKFQGRPPPHGNHQSGRKTYRARG